MLHILFVILKIILWILAGVLILAISLVLCVLLAPVRYRLQGSYDKTLDGSARVSWLLHILSAKAVYRENHLSAVLRIFGIPIFRWQPETEAHGSNGETELVPETGADLTIEELAEDEEEDMVLTATELRREYEKSADVERKLLDSENELFETEGKAEFKAKDDNRAHIHRESSVFSRIKKELAGLKRKIRNLIQRIQSAFQNGKEGFSSFKAVWKDEKNRETFQVIKKQGKVLFCHLKPKKIRGTIRFGFEDPSTTGKVLMAVSPFYGWYQKRVVLIPVFEEPVLEGELLICGRVQIAVLLLAAAKIYGNRNFRVLLKKWMG